MPRLNHNSMRNSVCSVKMSRSVAHGLQLKQCKQCVKKYQIVDNMIFFNVQYNQNCISLA